MTVEEFKELITRLTGRPVRSVPSDDAFLADAVKSDAQTIDCSQFNELLLIANKDRVEEAFFKYFFVAQGSDCSIGDIRSGVEKFQKTAMICFGNFIYAYRTLSKCSTLALLKEELGGHCFDSSELLSKLLKRRQSILGIIPIDKTRTYLLGYISSGEIREEHKIATGLDELFKKRTYGTWEDLKTALQSLKSAVRDTAVIDNSIRLIDRFRKRSANGSLSELREQIEKDLPQLNDLYETLRDTETAGIKNTDIYLTWDHMDLYFATSMRKRWEYEDLFRFVNSVMEEERLSQAGNKTLRELNVRHFDPTQSFDKNRINKGLIESLMLKRAACTVYSVQDTDTLGKDSELAATLAQGKPVIAYAPEINIEKRIAELYGQVPGTLRERLQFVLYADERVLASDLSSLSKLITRLEHFEEARLWRSVIDPTELSNFQKDNQEDIEKLCRIIASSEQRIYEKRANTLKKSHPLAIQVNLDTGVANGVIVVRSSKDCAELIWRILTNTMVFDILLDTDTDCWVLKERLTQSIYRVVTNSPKLTNCFWNFYPRERP
jgi:hypothetical protein